MQYFLAKFVWVISALMFIVCSPNLEAQKRDLSAELFERELEQLMEKLPESAYGYHEALKRPLKWDRQKDRLLIGHQLGTEEGGYECFCQAWLVYQRFSELGFPAKLLVGGDELGISMEHVYAAVEVEGEWRQADIAPLFREAAKTRQLQHLADAKEIEPDKAKKWVTDSRDLSVSGTPLKHGPMPYRYERVDTGAYITHVGVKSGPITARAIARLHSAALRKVQTEHVPLEPVPLTYKFQYEFLHIDKAYFSMTSDEMRAMKSPFEVLKGYHSVSIEVGLREYRDWQIDWRNSVGQGTRMFHPFSPPYGQTDEDTIVDAFDDLVERGVITFVDGENHNIDTDSIFTAEREREMKVVFTRLIAGTLKPFLIYVR